MKTAWQFKTKRFSVKLKIEQDYDYRYDGDDENGEVQAKLDSGEYMAFNSEVVVYLNGHEIGSDSLGGSVYKWDEVSEFWTAHRDKDPMNRNCSHFRATHGENSSICHYFPEMVLNAIKEARQFMADLPSMRFTKDICV